MDNTQRYIVEITYPLAAREHLEDQLCGFAARPHIELSCNGPEPAPIVDNCEMVAEWFATESLRIAAEIVEDIDLTFVGMRRPGYIPAACDGLPFSIEIRKAGEGRLSRRGTIWACREAEAAAE